MPRDTVEPTTDERGDERHPAWGMIGASRAQNGPPGATLFDSDIRHMHTVRVRVSTAARRRQLNHDYLHGERQFVEVEMSEAQWASFVSSMNVGDGVPCTVRQREEGATPETPFEPRLQESMREVRDAADEAAREVSEAFDAYAARKNAANLRTLRYAIANMPANVTFAGEALTEHAENVVQRARADVEAMVVAKAAQLGLEPGDLTGPALLDEGPTE